MTTIPLNCEGFAEVLADYLEREDSPRMRAALETHAANCVSCGALLSDLQQLRVDAGGLPTLTPSRDLWGGIADRIATPVIAFGQRAAGSGQRDARRFPVWLRPAAAAAALVVMTAGVTYFATREAVLRETQVAARPIDSTAMDPQKMVADAIDSARKAEGFGTRFAALSRGLSPDGRASGTADRAPVGSRGPRGYAPGSPRSGQMGGSNRDAILFNASNAAPADAMESVYGREIARLRRIIDERRGQLDTATVRVIERNLTIIDQAIGESRAALARDPASAFLSEQLNNVLEQKIELLRAAALLPVRS